MLPKVRRQNASSYSSCRAACGCPVVMGSHTFNFLEAAELAEAEGAAIRVADMGEGVLSATMLVNEPRALAKAVDAGLAFAARNRGATEGTLAALQGYQHRELRRHP